MIPAMCVVQEGQISPEVETRLKSRIGAFVQTSFDEPLDLDWIVVPKGSGFTAAKPSNGIVISMQASKPLKREERINALHSLCEICMSETGRTHSEVVVAVRDPA